MKKDFKKSIVFLIVLNVIGAFASKNKNVL